jgi:hypothetical protein
VTSTWYYVKSAASGSTTVTLNFTSDPSYGFGVNAACVSISGTDTTTTLDSTPVINHQDHPGAANVTSGNLTTTNAGSCLIGASVNTSGNTYTAGSGWTIRSGTTGIGSETQDNKATGTYAATFTGSADARFATGLLAFRASGGGGGGSSSRFLLLGVGP